MTDLGTVDDTAALRQLLQEALDEFDDDNDVLERAPPAAGVPSGPADDSGVAYAFSTPPRGLLAGAGQHARLSRPAGVARGAAGVAGAADDDEAECTPSPAQPPPVRTRAPKGGYRPRQLFSNEQPVVLRDNAEHVQRIQAAWRGLAARRLLRQARSAATRISACWRGLTVQRYVVGIFEGRHDSYLAKLQRLGAPYLTSVFGRASVLRHSGMGDLLLRWRASLVIGACWRGYTTFCLVERLYCDVQTRLSDAFGARYDRQRGATAVLLYDGVPGLVQRYRASTIIKRGWLELCERRRWLDEQRREQRWRLSLVCDEVPNNKTNQHEVDHTCPSTQPAAPHSESDLADTPTHSSGRLEPHGSMGVGSDDSMSAGQPDEKTSDMCEKGPIAPGANPATHVPLEEKPVRATVLHATTDGPPGPDTTPAPHPISGAKPDRLPTSPPLDTKTNQQPRPPLPSVSDKPADIFSPSRPPLTKQAWTGGNKPDRHLPYEYRQPTQIFDDIKQYDSWMRGTALSDGNARRVTDLLHDQLGGRDERVWQLDASAPAAEQLALFAEVGWPNGPPSAGYLKNKVVKLAEQNHLVDYDRISARYPRFEVVFPMTIEQFASARPCKGSYAGDPVYWLTCNGRMVGPDEEEELDDDDGEFDGDEFDADQFDGKGD